MTNRRIVLVNRYFHPDESATSRMLSDLSAHLAETADVVVLCSRQLLDNPDAGLASRESVGRVRVNRLWSTSFGRDWLPGRALDYVSFLASAGAWLVLDLRRGDVVVAKTDPPLLGTVAAVASVLKRATLVNWLQDLYPETAWRLGVGSGKSWIGRAIRRLRNQSLRRAAINVVISEGMATRIDAVTGGASTRVIENWSDDMTADCGESLRDELGLGGQFVVGYCGNLGRAHPLEPFQQLAERLHDDPLFHFLMVGGGAHMASLRDWMTARPAPNWTFLPYQPRERLRHLLATPDVHLTALEPALEGLILPSKIYGVMSAGRPVLHLGDPRGEVARLLRRHACGWTIAPSDPTGLVALLKRLVRSPQEVSVAGANARAAYLERYDKAKAMERWGGTMAPLLR